MSVRHHISTEEKMIPWIIAVDDEIEDLRTAEDLFSRNNMHITALRSGKELISYVCEKGFPDLIVINEDMPETDGKSTLELLRNTEKNMARKMTPVALLSEKDPTEKERILAVGKGVCGYIKKPAAPDDLLDKINYFLTAPDKLTGFLYKSAERELTRACGSETGCLLKIVINKAQLKHLHDIIGHAAYDSAIKTAAELISENVRENSILARTGGLEFMVFACGMNPEEIGEFAEKIFSGMDKAVSSINTSDHDITVGLYVGAVSVPKYGREYASLAVSAEKAVQTALSDGDRGYCVFGSENACDPDDISTVEADLKSLSAAVGEKNIPNSALMLDKNSFSCVYQYIMRYMMRNRKSACKILFTILYGTEENKDIYDRLCSDFGTNICNTLRKTDILMRCGNNQYFVLLTDIREASVVTVIGHIIRNWRDIHKNEVLIKYETEFVGNETSGGNRTKEARIVVVDDDVTNLKTASHILTKGGFFVTALKSGKALLDYAVDHTPDLVLLDVNMPVLNGFETLEKLRALGSESADIPIIFLTSDDSVETENKSLSLGAMDFIKKPFVPDILLLRVRHIIGLVTLQKSLSSEVERKTNENKELFVHVIRSLADAIDAKDTYTNGHSGRVAEYSTEIAKRAGYSIQQQDDIYMIGLLHDVGKIGVPDAVINKASRLTDEEFKLIKMHPELGARILKNIREMPKLAVGARWHHERYGGGGYPDGLKGTDIPEEARIIAVADAYDAMTSNRSYRRIMSQEQVRAEIEKGKGTQFDPKFADIMLEMIDEDKDYTMREK